MGKRLFLAAILMGCIMGMEAKKKKKAYTFVSTYYWGYLDLTAGRKGM